MADLRTDYKDDVLNINTNERRKYRMINNADGTISFEDVTDYMQNGDSFGATDVNTITERVNRSLTGADVVDNLESTATDLPLSANMGRELDDKISKNDFGTRVDISSYTTLENAFVCPCDGYVAIAQWLSSATSENTVLLSVYGANSNPEINMRVWNYLDVQSLYVKKGMRCVFNSDSSNGAATFTPII